MLHFYEQQNHLPLHPTSNQACMTTRARTAHSTLENQAMQNSFGAGGELVSEGQIKRASSSPLRLQQSNSVSNILFILSLLKTSSDERIWKMMENKKDKEEEGKRSQSLLQPTVEDQQEKDIWAREVTSLGLPKPSFSVLTQSASCSHYAQ